MAMKLGTALRKLGEIEAELETLVGRRNRSTELGRRNHNRSSTLYRRRKNMLRIIEERLCEKLS